MSIPSGRGIQHWITLEKQASFKSDVRAGTAKRENGFDALLKEVLVAGKSGQDSNSPSSPPTKTEIENLLNRMQMEMSARLWLSVVSDKEDETPSNSFLSSLLALSENLSSENLSVSSKSRRSHQKTAVPFSKKELEPIIERAADTYQIDADLIRSVIKAESNFNTNAVSPKGAMGLMQLMPDTARELGVKNACDPEENIMAGTRYLKGLLKRYNGNVSLALAAYNWGMGNVEKYPQKLPAETRTYISRITQLYRDAKA